MPLSIVEKMEQNISMRKRDSQNVRIFHPSKMENKKSSRQVCCVEIRNERIIFEKIERKTKVNRENIITYH